MLGKIEGKRRRGDRGWDGWMASLTQWTWVWVNSGRWWRTGKPGVLQLMGSPRVGHEQQHWCYTFLLNFVCLFSSYKTSFPFIYYDIHLLVLLSERHILNILALFLSNMVIFPSLPFPFNVRAFFDVSFFCSQLCQSFPVSALNVKL